MVRMGPRNGRAQKAAERRRVREGGAKKGGEMEGKERIGWWATITTRIRYGWNG